MESFLGLGSVGDCQGGVIFSARLSPKHRALLTCCVCRQIAITPSSQSLAVYSE